MEAMIVPRRCVREASRVLARAFWTYPETLHLLPRTRARARVLPRKLTADCSSAARFGTLFGIEQAGHLVGAVACLPPGAYPISLGRQAVEALRFAPAAPWGASALAEAMRGRDGMRDRHPREPHWFVRALGVEPSWQRRGVGGCLLDPVLTRADGAGVGVYLSTAHGENVAWYARFGFSVVDEFRPTPRWPVVWTLWRDPDG